MAGLFARFWKDRSGATAIEYGLIAVLVAVAIISGATALGTSVKNMLNSEANKVTAAGS